MLVGNLIKTPLTAVLFASIYSYFLTLTAFFNTEAYKETLSEFSMPFLAYIFMISYGFLLSAILAMVFIDARSKGLKLVLMLLAPFIGTQWLAPAFEPLLSAQALGYPPRFDLLLKLISGVLATLVLLFICLLLFKTVEKPAANRAPKPSEKYKIKWIDLAIKLIVLPMIYCVIYFLAWYFLLWRFEPVQIFYAGNAEDKSFIQEIVNMLLTNPMLVPLAMGRGLLYALSLLTLLIELCGKRLSFMISSTLLFMGPAARMLIASPTMPDAVRIAHLIEMAAVALVYGALASFMMHTSILKEVSQPPPAPAAKPKRAKPKPVEASETPAAT